MLAWLQSLVRVPISRHFLPQYWWLLAQSFCALNFWLAFYDFPYVARQIVTQLNVNLGASWTRFFCVCSPLYFQVIADALVIARSHFSHIFSVFLLLCSLSCCFWCSTENFQCMPTSMYGVAVICGSQGYSIVVMDSRGHCCVVPQFSVT